MTSLHATRLSEPGTLSRRGTTSQVRASLPVTRESVSNCGGLSVRSDGTREPNPYGSVFLWEPELIVLIRRLALSGWRWVSCPEPGPRRPPGWGQGTEPAAASAVAGVARPPPAAAALPHTAIPGALTRVPAPHSTHRPPSWPVWAPRAAWDLGARHSSALSVFVLWGQGGVDFYVDTKIDSRNNSHLPADGSSYSGANRQLASL